MKRYELASFCISLVLLLPVFAAGVEEEIEDDTTPPYVWDHYPPPEASNVVPTTDIAFKVTDTQSGPRLSRISVFIDGERPLTDYYEVGSDTYLLLNYKIGGFEPGRIVLISIDAEDWAGNVMARHSYHLTTCAAAPRINSGGYLFSNLCSDGGKLMIAADISSPMCGIGDIGVYFGLNRTGIQLRDDGTGGDLIAHDGIWMTEMDLGPGLFPGEAMLAILARDWFGFGGFAWPFLGVKWDLVPDPFPPFSEFDSRRWVRLVDTYLAKEGPLDGYRPVIATAGYWHTNVFSHGGFLHVAAMVLDPDGPQDIDTVALLDCYGDRTGLYLNDEGICGDVVPGDEIYAVTYPTLLGGDPSMLYLFKIVAFDKDGNASDPWPFLRINE